MEEALIEMYPDRGIRSVCGGHYRGAVGQQSISLHDQRAKQESICIHIEDWRNRPLQSERDPYVYVDGIYLRRNWRGEFENVAILVAIAVKEDEYREVLGSSEGMKEDKASSF